MILLQVGQAGIQVGQAVVKELQIHKNESLQQLLIDTESKTMINPSNKHSIQLDSSGRGNNWAHGYSDTPAAIPHEFRKIVEAENRFKGTCIIASVAGGTGSGLGSKILEQIRDEYPKQCIISCPIIPFANGETALQHYNSTLAISWMQRYSDMIIMNYNDQLLYSVSKQIDLTSAKSRNVSLQDLNESIGYSLSGIFLPVSMVNHDPLFPQKLKFGNVKRFDPWDIIESVVPIPDLKMVTVSSSRLGFGLSSKLEQSATWEDVTTNLTRNIHTSSISDFKPKTLFSNLYIRGIQSGDFFKKLSTSIPQKIQQKIGKILLGPGIQSIYSSLHGLDLKSQLKSLSLISNSTFPIIYLQDTLNRVELKVSAGAYLHWYQRYIPDIKEELKNSMEILTNVKNIYQEMHAYI